MQATPTTASQTTPPASIHPPIPLTFCGYIGHKIYKECSMNKWGALVFIFKSVLTLGTYAVFQTYDFRKKFLRDPNKLNYLEKIGIKKKDFTISLPSGKNCVISYRAAGRIRFNSLGDVYISLPEKTHETFSGLLNSWNVQRK